MPPLPVTHMSAKLYQVLYVHHSTSRRVNGSTGCGAPPRVSCNQIISAKYPWYTHPKKKEKEYTGTAVVLTRAAVIEERFPVLPLLEKKKSGISGTLAFLFLSFEKQTRESQENKSEQKWGKKQNQTIQAEAFFDNNGPKMWSKKKRKHETKLRIRRSANRCVPDIPPLLGGGNAVVLFPSVTKHFL